MPMRSMPRPTNLAAGDAENIGRLRVASCFVFIDDMLVVSKTFEEQLVHLREVFKNPTDATRVRQFVGLALFYRHFIPNLRNYCSST